MLLAAVYKSPQRIWIDIDIRELLCFRNKTILAGDLNAKHPVWNNEVSNPSGLKLLELFLTSNFEISTPQCPTHYTPDGKGDVLDIVVHQNIRLLQVIVTDILNSDHISIMFTILDPVIARKALNPVEKFTNWEQFQSITYELISPNTLLHSSNKADKAARDFAASLASTYTLSTIKTIISNTKYEIPSLLRLLNYRRKFRSYGKKPWIQYAQQQ
jgi:hypothetical protein